MLSDKNKEEKEVQCVVIYLRKGNYKRIYVFVCI